MKLTRKQELALIDIGLKQLLNSIANSNGIREPRGPYKKKRFIPWNKGKKLSATKYGWTAERRRKFSETMKKKWASKDK